MFIFTSLLLPMSGSRERLEFLFSPMFGVLGASSVHFSSDFVLDGSFCLGLVFWSSLSHLFNLDLVNIFSFSLYIPM